MFWGRFLFLSLILTASAHGQSLPATRVMPLGDSLTAGGYNLQRVWHVGGGYREHLWRKLSDRGYDFDFVGPLLDGAEFFPDAEHAGYSGWRIDQLTEVVEKNLNDHSPEVILLLIGTNDVMQNYNLSQAPDRLEALVKKLFQLSPKLQLFVASLPITSNQNYNSKIKRFNAKSFEKLRALKSEHTQLHWVDIFNLSGLNQDKEDLTDGVHPTRAGYEKISQVWFQALQATEVLLRPKAPTLLEQNFE